MPTPRFLKGQMFGQCGNHIRPDLDMMRRINAAFEILKAPCFRTSAITVRGCEYGPNLWQEHLEAEDALRVLQKAKENLRRSGTDGKMMRPTGRPGLPIIGRLG